jgi:hypothetical protein
VSWSRRYRRERDTAGTLGEDHALRAMLLGVVYDGESTSFAEELIA